MSNSVFPAFSGIQWNVKKTPVWRTLIQTASSGKELRASFMSSPTYKFEMSYEVLRAAAVYGELQTLIGFFNLRKGSFESFLYEDIDDCTATDQVFGEGNAVTTTFQLVRAYGAHVETIMNLKDPPVIENNNVLLVAGVDYNVGTTGNVVFVLPPANGASLSWSGTFYYRVRFDRDSIDFEQFMKDLWNAKKVALVGSLGNKI